MVLTVIDNVGVMFTWSVHISKYDMNYLIALIAARPKVYLDELQEELYASRNADVSIATISWALRHWEMSNKHVASEALERNELLQAIWQAEYGDIPAEYCVWLDKASVDDKTNQRQNGAKLDNYTPCGTNDSASSTKGIMSGE
ncbi:uncharacterized protein LACBIDRAFT_331921 [Laccaria bicolor S238N-H82]|uniref:Predicted protein n=1 Tax=Laccaria bicolor (strain S238N-H82 / ATCC MYA-4686) TaxID=486041 RepID=B0DR19_LACBS|nr:uncharacterized protein LACBIDRAFT_331919 [Laccaria bicolor S238N-H82]XP_001886411.1 uncharacterized protein LACBIDRAFT_331921 [Laccaria bicolor S238N-H82]EDR02986.1 predicted protein [Laccaria bicolor S238N-H82]EDR02988.1 predicted protein [Laccaria bicolor S238N-H82]|eukprot:XP_001886409.1 predicted protein [Laccaria bicolor S238N-H82]